MLVTDMGANPVDAHPQNDDPQDDVFGMHSFASKTWLTGKKPLTADHSDSNRFAEYQSVAFNEAAQTE